MRKIAEIQGNSAEPASLKQKIRAAEDLIEIPASHPEQATHVDACRSSGFRIEGIGSVHERADFALLYQ